MSMITVNYHWLFLPFAAVAADQTLNEGQSLLDQLALPVKNAFGKDITPDNKPHIEHVQKMMEDLQVGASSSSKSSMVSAT